MQKGEGAHHRREGLLRRKHKGHCPQGPIPQERLALALPPMGKTILGKLLQSASASMSLPAKGKQQQLQPHKLLLHTWNGLATLEQELHEPWLFLLALSHP